MVVRHPLHAFSAESFGGRADSRLFSYSAENRRAAVTTRGGPVDREPEFLAAPLASLPGDGAVVDLETLRRFLRNPAKFFLQERLGVRLPRTVGRVTDRERFALEGREKFVLKQAWLDRWRECGSADE